MEDKVLLDVQGLKTYFHTFKGVVKAVDNVSFSLKEGEILGIVGESGSGKSVTSFSILKLVEDPGVVDADHIMFDGKDLAKISEKDMSKIRGKDISMVFQDPMTSLNPLYTIQRQMEEVLILHEPQMNKAQRRERCIELLHAVGIPNPEERLKEYPNQFSGGMRQRVIIAIALATNPKLLIADEPTTALDVTIQEQILKLMKKLVKEHNTSLMLITHDLAVVSQMVDKINVPGMVPNMFELPEGCYFAPRCKYCQEICRHEKPQMQEVGPGHMAACHFPLLKKKEQEEA